MNNKCEHEWRINTNRGGFAGCEHFYCIKCLKFKSINNDKITEEEIINE